MTIPQARFWRPDEDHEKTGKIVCELCPHACRISPGKTGRCGVRKNESGCLLLPNYGLICSLARDPIEKKPLYHFYPGSEIISLGTNGCNLSCLFCQNYDISQPEDKIAFSALRSASVEELARAACGSSIAFTYNEPSISAEFVIDAARACRANGARTVAVSNGMIHGAARREFYAVLDGVNIDLKSFSAEFYRKYCGGNLETVQETIRYVARETDVWLELTTLLIPTLNDSDDEIRALCDWVAATCGPETPLHFSAFFPTFRLTDLPRTPPETLFHARKIAQKAGLRYIYCGNIADRESQTTRCPTCGEALIERDGFRKVKISLRNGCCSQCGHRIAGRFLEC